MPTPSCKKKDGLPLAVLAWQKLLCDVLFGACSMGDYERLSGRKLGAFSLCLVGLGGQDDNLAERIRSLHHLPGYKRAAVFACAPHRIALLAEQGKQSAAICAAVRQALEAMGVQCFAMEAAEGRGAEQLHLCYLQCSCVLDGRLGQGGLGGQGHADEAVPVTNVKPMLAKAMDFISWHYTEKITLGDVAAHAYASPSYISRLFNQELGVSFVDYLGLMRIDRAKQLLRDSRLKVFEVSELTGVADAHYFAKLFKKHTGISPSEYRTAQKI